MPLVCIPHSTVVLILFLIYHLHLCGIHTFIYNINTVSFQHLCICSPMQHSIFEIELFYHTITGLLKGERQCNYTITRTKHESRTLQLHCFHSMEFSSSRVGRGLYSIRLLDPGSWPWLLISNY